MKTHKIIAFGLADTFFIVLALTFAFLLRFEGTIPAEYHGRFFIYAGILLVLNLFFLWREKLYAFTWEFVSLQELGRIFKAVSYASAIFAILVLISFDRFPLFDGFPRSVILINYILDLVFVGALRIGKRAWQEIFRKGGESPDAEATLIVGAGPEGEQLLRGLLKFQRRLYRVVGMVDERPDKKGIVIHETRVLGAIEDIPKLIAENKIKHVIIALTSAEATTIRRAVELARQANIQSIKIVPDTHELLSGRLKLTDLREIKVEDLLGRNPAQIDTAKISEFIKRKVVLVTGAAGSIGSEIARQCLAFEPEKLLLLDFNESGLFDLNAELSMANQKNSRCLQPIVANINDGAKIEKIISQFKPAIIFHAAAYKHVPLMEEFPEEAVATNVFGTLSVAEAAQRHGVPKFVLISTDKAIRPVSVMGKTKRAAEIIVQTLNAQNKTKFVSVRFGNVIGSRGSVVPLFEEQIKRRAPLTVTHPEMTRYFMTIPEAALLVMEAGAVGQGGEIFMLDMGRPVKIAEVAREMVRLAGLTPDVDVPIVFTGIRPGEKILEEIFSEEEKAVGQTQWDKIFITKNQNSKPPELVKENLKKLELTLAQSPEATLTALDKFLNA